MRIGRQLRTAVVGGLIWSAALGTGAAQTVKKAASPAANSQPSSRLNHVRRCIAARIRSSAPAVATKAAVATIGRAASPVR